MHARNIDNSFIYGKQLQDVRTNQNEVYLVLSNQDARTSSDGLIHLLWNYHKRFENRALACVQFILNLVN
jgi:ABC-type thiamine transport system substrate-binding protein